MLFFESVLFALCSKLSVGLGIVEAFNYETIFYTHVLSLYLWKMPVTSMAPISLSTLGSSKVVTFYFQLSCF